MRGALSLAATLTAALVPASAAWAAPTASEAPIEDAAEDAPADEEDRLTRVRELFAEGAAKFELADCAAAIAAWGEAYELAPLELRGQLRVPLANAHACQYQADDDPEHMRRAQVLYRDALEALDAADEDTRLETEALLREVEAELERREAEAEARERELAEREAQAREQAARELVEQQAAVADPYTEQEQRRFRRMSGLGGALLVTGASGLGVMAMAMALGQRADTLGSQLGVGEPYSEYARIRDEGRAWNATAITTGVVGGALVASGVAVLVVALLERERARQSPAEPSARHGLEPRPRLRLNAGANGLELRF